MAVSYSKWKLRAKDMSGSWVDGVATYIKEDGNSYMLTTSGEIQIQPNTTTVHLSKIGSTQSYFGDIIKLTKKTGNRESSYIQNTIDLPSDYLDTTKYILSIYKTFDETSDIRDLHFFPCSRTTFLFRGRLSDGVWREGTGLYLDGSTEKLVLNDGSTVDIVTGTGSIEIFVTGNKILFYGDIVSIGERNKIFKLVTYGQDIPRGTLEGNKWNNPALEAICS